MLPVPSDERGMSFMDNFHHILIWRRRAPKFTTFRVNSLVTSPLLFAETLKEKLAELSVARESAGLESSVPHIWLNPKFPEVVAFGSWALNGELPQHELEVIVDPACGAAVLRGANVFAPGVIGLLPGATIGDIVSVYANIGSTCKRGWTQKIDANERYFVGNGVLLMDRKQLFSGDGLHRGIAVLVTDNRSGCPSLPSNFIKPGTAVMQNLPSIVCGRVLDPQPGEVILDMCAAPGNKTSHLAALMNNLGIIIALDRSASRILKLKELCKELSVTNVLPFVYNSVNAVDLQKEISLDGKCDLQCLKAGPPFPPCCFDRILLDAPCSGLGQRPRLDPVDVKHIVSLPPLQKKLFQTAVMLLKAGGVLVYSTCTVVCEENEGIVRWALDQFPCLKLVSAEPRLDYFSSSEDSFKNTLLSSSEWECVQKFVPIESEPLEENVCERDTIGFFIAKFRKQI
ncbi:tRNA (cytosine(72)-C(5))-methyltransferase NSUN6 [Frankliniella fusca]|uniref:tRNA (Cytosine(72)-C(5))-methyltransferase NSUN6 n=1 Tax=Frankliniella fusca TaxID=407009 RepID=A0AAE1HEG7_9NEOP|nr:tRNA (cytosine(72)-C(5))-methyltransferase NSUN6 [Frankliniella fusca]